MNLPRLFITLTSFILFTIVDCGLRRSSWTDALAEGIIERSRAYYQLTVFKKISTGGGRASDGLLIKLMASLPTAMIDLSYSDSAPHATTRRSTMYILLIDSEIATEPALLLDVLVRATRPGSSLPRCLCVIVSIRNCSEINSTLSRILRYSWSKRFLDFTIALESPDEIEPRLLYYNPFVDVIYDEVYNEETNDLFPDKLLDMHGYGLKIPFVDSPPYMQLKGNDTYVGTEYSVVFIASQILNFTLVIEVIHANNDTGVVAAGVRALEANVLNLFPVAFFAKHPLVWKNDKIIPGRMFAFESFRALASPFRIANNTDSERPLQLASFAAFLISLFVLMILVIFTVHRLGIIKKNFHVYSVVQILLQESVRSPIMTPDRIIYLSLVLVSMTYFSDLYAMMTNSELVKSPLPLRNYEDVVKSGLTPYVSEGYYDWIFNNPDHWVQAMKSRTKTGHTSICVSYILEGKPVICMAYSSKVNMYYRRHRYNISGESKLRVAELKFLTSGKSLIFENTSPYVEKFNKIMLQLQDPGIINYWKKISVLDRERLDKIKREWLDKNNSELQTLVTFILVLSYIGATVVLALELSLRCFKIAH